MVSSKVSAKSKTLVKLLELFREPPIVTVQDGLPPDASSGILHLPSAVVPSATDDMLGYQTLCSVRFRLETGLSIFLR